MRDNPRTRPRSTFHELAALANTVVPYGGGGAPTTIVCGSLSFERAHLKPITQLLPPFILVKADQTHTVPLQSTMQALASETGRTSAGIGSRCEQASRGVVYPDPPGHIALKSERHEGWLLAIFDPQIGTALSAVHDRVDNLWTVGSLAEAAGMSRSAFAIRFRELLGQTPLEYVIEWRMQKGMQLLQRRDRKLVDVARAVGYESDAAFSKAFKRVVGYSPGEYLKRNLKASNQVEMKDDQT
jgi:AraC-like DNA-binding protein